MTPGNSSWLPWTFSERALCDFAFACKLIHTGSDDLAKGPPKPPDLLPVVAAISPRCWRRHPGSQFLVFCAHIQSNRPNAPPFNGFFNKERDPDQSLSRPATDRTGPEPGDRHWPIGGRASNATGSPAQAAPDPAGRRAPPGTTS